MDPVCSVVKAPPGCAAPQRWHGFAMGVCSTLFLSLPPPLLELFAGDAEAISTSAAW